MSAVVETQIDNHAAKEGIESIKEAERDTAIEDVVTKLLKGGEINGHNIISVVLGNDMLTEHAIVEFCHPYTTMTQANKDKLRGDDGVGYGNLFNDHVYEWAAAHVDNNGGEV